jgi:hypothetical protein
MPEKKRKPDDEDDADAKKPPGRPKVLPPDLNKRHQLRCSSRDFDLWEEYSRSIGFPNVSAWIRKVVNDALPIKQRRRVGEAVR